MSKSIDLPAFYEIAQAIAPGDNLWICLDAAQTSWRDAVLSAIAPSCTSALHIGASARLDYAATAALWPAGCAIHLVEPDQAGVDRAAPTVADLKRADRTAALTAYAVSAERGPLVAARDASSVHRRAWVAPGESGPAGAVLSPAVQTISLDELGRRTQPDVIILEDLGMVGEALASAGDGTFARFPLMLFATAERSWTPASWTAALARLSAHGYVAFDPSGAELNTTADWHAAPCWYAVAVPITSAPEREAMLRRLIRKAADQFRASVFGYRNLALAAPAPFEATVEIVSLETAARAVGAKYLASVVEPKLYDINARKMVDRPVKLEAAQFAEVDVLPGAMWKVCVNRHLYIEEIGYSDRGRLHGVTSYPGFEGRTIVYEPSATLEIPDVPDGAILFGGDPAYYHFILNWLPRLRAIPMADALGGRTERLHFVISERLPERYLRYFELLLDRPFDVTRVPERGVWRFRNLIVPSFCSSHQLHPSISKWYRETLGIPRRLGRKRYWLSRRDARAGATPRRKVENDDEVMAALSPLGFEPLLLEGEDPETQINLFRDAEFVVGPHGAAFANMQFTPAGAKALVLENEWDHAFMLEMLVQAGHAADKIVCKDVIRPDYEAKYTIDGVIDPEIRRSRDMVADPAVIASKVAELLNR